MDKLVLSAHDYHLLYYFSVVAEERSIQAAANRLFISQPPLSRQIRRLERNLGLKLFIRHSKGLELTPEGAKTLEIIRPLISLQAETFRALSRLRQDARDFTLGLTTAVDQEIFAGLLAKLALVPSGKISTVRKPSPRLVKDILRNRLHAAVTVLPVTAQDLPVIDLRWSEPLMAVMPMTWPEAHQSRVQIAQMSGRPLFWFCREQNQAWYDHMLALFRHAGFKPLFLEEPPEHDVLLARIAMGEGMSLMPASFAPISRPNVAFKPLAEDGLFRIHLGLVSRNVPSEIREIICSFFAPPYMA